MNPGSRKTQLTAFDVARLCQAYPRSVASEAAKGAPWLRVAAALLLVGGLVAAGYIIARRRPKAAR